jgi:intracellular multiplication protein IcmQ
LAAIDRILQTGDWESSLFLRNTIRPVNNLRDKVVHLQTILLNEHAKQTIVAPEILAGRVPVYISLFQTEGLNLSRWAMQVRALANYVQGRPIYRVEEAVMQMIRSKLDGTNDAYVVVAIPKETIMIESTARLDRNGCELLNLSDHAVRDSQFIEFVHQQKRYCWIDYHLVLQGNPR